MFGERWDHSPSIRLPLQLPYSGRSGFWFAAVFATFVGVHIAMMVFFVIIMSMQGKLGQFPVSAPPIDLILALAAVSLLRSVSARRRIGPGMVTMTQSGFWDDRLTSEPISWASFKDAKFYTSGKSQRLAGVWLHVDPQAVLPPLNSDYRLAFQPWTRLDKCIKVDLIRFRRRRQLAQFIVDLANRTGSAPKFGNV